MTATANSMQEQLQPVPDSVSDPGRNRPPLAARLFSHQGLVSVLDQAVVSGTSFVTSVVIGRLCSREELGTYSLALSLVLFLRGMQGELVSSPYVIYCQRREKAGLASYTGSTLVHHLCLTILSVAVLLGLAVLFRLGMGPAGLSPVLIVLAGALPFLLVREYIRQLSLCHLKMAAVLAVDSCVAALQLGGLLLLAYFQVLTIGAAFAVMGAGCAAACLGWFLTAREPMRIVPARLVPDWRHNWAFGRWSLAGFLVGSTTPYLMPWIVAVARGEAATGVLAACTTLVNLSGMYVTGVANVLTPRAARAFAHGGVDELRHVLRQTALLFAVTLGMFCLLVLVAGDLPARLVYGSRYAGTGTILLLLALTMLVNSLGITFGNGLWALDQPRANFAADVCTLAVTVSLVSYLVGPFGVTGAAAALLAGAGAGAGMRCLTLQRRLKALDRQREAA